jgi:hypothetical protein
MPDRTSADRSRRNAFIAAALAAVIPGTGHFYLGFMQRGLVLMLLFALDIAAIPYFAMGAKGANIPLIVLFGCLIPVIYFYTIFDAVHMARKSNRTVSVDRQSGFPPDSMELNKAEMQSDLAGMELDKEDVQTDLAGERPTGEHLISAVIVGGVLMLAGAALLLYTHNPAWLQWFSRIDRSYIGASLLIGAGIFLYLKDKRTK